MELYDNLLNWLKIDNNNIGIFDATNTDKNKKNYYLKGLKKYNYYLLNQFVMMKF